MTDMKLNPLAELAERLIGWSDWFKDQRGTMIEHDIRKAQCIVAELAKASLDNLVTPYLKCRAIAEEGAQE